MQEVSDMAKGSGGAKVGNGTRNAAGKIISGNGFDPSRAQPTGVGGQWRIRDDEGNYDIYTREGRYVTTILGKPTANTAYVMPGARTSRRRGRTVRERISDRRI